MAKKTKDEILQKRAMKGFAEHGISAVKVGKKIINTKDSDYRSGQKVIATLSIEDQGQDFIELDVLENGVILGDSVMFSHGRLSLIGIGSADGIDYFTLADLKAQGFKTSKVKGLLIYMKDTGSADPLPWKATTLKYKVEKSIKVKDASRFIK